MANVGHISSPGVYINEIVAMPAGVVPVATAVAAFVGYTEFAIDPASQKSLAGEPVQITSLADYRACFGGPAAPHFTVTASSGTKPAFSAAITQPDDSVVTCGFDLNLSASGAGSDRFCLSSQIELFFLNGGGPCWVISVGCYGSGSVTIEASALLDGVTASGLVVGPTMLVVPEACQLGQVDYTSVIDAMVAQAGNLRDRVAILDLPACLAATDIAALTKAQDDLWQALAPQADHLSFAAAYGPALATTIVQARDVRFPVLTGADNSVMNAILTTQAVALFSGPSLATLQGAIAAAFPVAGATTNTPALSGDASAYPPPVAPGAAELLLWQQRLDDLLTNALPVYVEIGHLIAEYLNVQPPSGAIAGAWAKTDALSGVWNAPANIALSGVANPLCLVTDVEQAGFNVPINGMAINIVRQFPGRGSLIWGARTLDGNSQDYRYIQVRRTLIYVEQSIKLALQSHVFDSNDNTTWNAVVVEVSAFLNGLWAEGGLLGTTASDAFSVQCGLGKTMTGQDVLDGYMIVTVSLQMIHPAEFIELTFQQVMQGG